MKINRMAEEKLAPSWVFDSPDKMEGLDLITSEEIASLENIPSSLSNIDLVTQRDKIETCAARGSAYYCNANWGEKVQSDLKEYATVCGLGKSLFKVVAPEQVESAKSIQAEADATVSKEIRKAELRVQASVSNAEAVELVMEDPFHLDEIAAKSELNTAWTGRVQPQQELDDRPSMMSGAIKGLRGGENYYENSDINLAANQNSITDPGAIQTLAESEAEDTGARLKREQEDKAAQKIADHKTWEQDKVDFMAPKGDEEVLPHGSVFPTEVMNAQPGIYTEVERPEKTMGEKLAEMNEDRRKEIQGEDQDDHEFKPSKASSFGVSDTFADELKKQLGQ